MALRNSEKIFFSWREGFVQECFPHSCYCSVDSPVEVDVRFRYISIKGDWESSKAEAAFLNKQQQGGERRDKKQRAEGTTAQQEDTSKTKAWSKNSR